MPEGEINGGREASFSGDAMNMRKVSQPGVQLLLQGVGSELALKGPSAILQVTFDDRALGTSHVPHDQSSEYFSRCFLVMDPIVEGSEVPYPKESFPLPHTHTHH